MYELNHLTVHGAENNRKIPALPFTEFIASISVLPTWIQKLRDYVVLLDFHTIYPGRTFWLLYPFDIELL